MQNMPARGSGGISSPRRFLKIRPSKGESESVFSSFSVENSYNFSIKSRLIVICMSNYHACIIIFSFVATKHLNIAS